MCTDSAGRSGMENSQTAGAENQSPRTTTSVTVGFDTDSAGRSGPNRTAGAENQSLLTSTHPNSAGRSDTHLTAGAGNHVSLNTMKNHHPTVLSTEHSITASLQNAAVSTPECRIGSLSHEQICTPTMTRNRKRNLSMPNESEVKKINSDEPTPCISSGDGSSNAKHLNDSKKKSPKQRKVQKAKRNLLNAASVSPIKPSNKLKSTKQSTKAKSLLIKPVMKQTSKKTTKQKRNMTTDDPNLSENTHVKSVYVNTQTDIEAVQGPCDDVSCDISGTDLVNVLSKFTDEMAKLNSTMNKMREDLHQKIDKVAEDVEQKLSKKFNNMLDSRVNKEFSKSKKEIEKQVSECRDELNTDISCLQSQIDEINSSNRDLNICIRNHPQCPSENVEQIVSDLLTDGLKLSDLRFKQASRKQRTDDKPGVIIVTFYSVDDRETVLQNKSLLKDTLKYEFVYLGGDQSPDTRININNLKLLVSALRIPGLKVRGSRLVNEDSNERSSNSAGRSSNSAGQRRPAESQPSAPQGSYSDSVKTGSNTNSGFKRNNPEMRRGHDGANFSDNSRHNNTGRNDHVYGNHRTRHNTHRSPTRNFSNRRGSFSRNAFRNGDYQDRRGRDIDHDYHRDSNRHSGYRHQRDEHLQYRPRRNRHNDFGGRQFSQCSYRNYDNFN